MTASDLRFALRRLRRHAAASIAATLTLALGVGAVTALFSVVRAVLLRPPPFRAPHELVECLYREMAFPHGCVLLTGTGVVPPDDFTLCPGDEIEIEVSGIGVLRNTVERG